MKDCSPVQYWLGLTAKLKKTTTATIRTVKGVFILIALSNLLNCNIGAVEAGGGDVGPLEVADGCVANGHLGPVGLAPGGRVGKTKN